MNVRKTAAAIKICGLQDVEVLKSMKHLTVDYIGFVFARSKRQVTADKASILCKVLNEWDRSPRPKAAGVFVNPEWDDLADVVTKVPLDVVQLHGQEAPEFCQKVREELGVEVLKAFSVHQDPESQEAALDVEAYEGKVDGILLDTYDGVYGGGSGKTFAWNKSIPYKEWAQRAGIPLFMAGGLNMDNVSELVREYAPDGVDVSSGVETEGIKDIVKMTAFVERVKKA
ncbi:phosphoribosylanthranilate isomerase [Neobacillus mesonae]|nr:phosphoribosylanthranilate isomerase [Neobacillus mesonae]